jgi:beta-glucosidase
MAAVSLYKRRRRDLLAPVPRGRTLRFPDGFLFGAATSSHQVEGENPHSDWWRFERQPGRVQNFTNFPEFGQCRKSDHWRQFDQDVERMREELSLSGYRFSVEWSRVEPAEGRFDEAAIERYVAMCARLREAGIRPMVTLFHWSSPDWIWDHARESETGWYAPSIVERFARFCDQVVPRLSPHVDLWCTLNEPNIFLYGAFSEGVLAPGHRARDGQLPPILAHLFACHVRAHALIKRLRPDAQVGIANNFMIVEPSSPWNPLEGLVAAQIEQQFTWSFPDAVRDGYASFRSRSGRMRRIHLPGLRGTVDYLGVNYYERMLVRVKGVDLRRPELLHDHRGTKEVWPREIYTRGFVDVLRAAWRRYGLPIYVTENGRSHPDDGEREAFLREHLRALAHTISAHGVDVRGYFYWSLLDNQEWAQGFVPRLGLYEVDYATGARTLRQTGRSYAEIARAGAITT